MAREMDVDRFVAALEEMVAVIGQPIEVKFAPATDDHWELVYIGLKEG